MDLKRPNPPFKDRSSLSSQKSRSKSVWFKRSHAMLKFGGPKRVQNSLNLSRERNCSHMGSMPFKPFKIQIREGPHSCLSPSKRLFDFHRQFTQKLKYSDFNDLNLSCFWISKFEHSLRSLKPDGFGPGFL